MMQLFYLRVAQQVCWYIAFTFFLSGMWVSSGLKKYCITKYKMVTKIARERERERELVLVHNIVVVNESKQG